MDYVWRWDITIPEDWHYGDWNHVCLAPHRAPLPVVRCNACGKPVRVIPAFMVKGTTLTLGALVFLAFVYENSPLAWRSLPEKFCKRGERIAHSTLYRAVHGLGRNLLEDEASRELYTGWNIPDDISSEASETAWPPEKSRYPHTQRREAAVRDLLTFFLCLMESCSGFIRLLLRFVEQICLLFSQMKKPVQKLYTKHGTAKATDTS